MNDRLENFVRDNRKEFDQFDPPPALWDKIEKQLDEKRLSGSPVRKTEKVVRLSFLLKIAATVVVVVAVALGGYQYNKKEVMDLSNIDPQLARQQVHYATLIEIKRSELKQIEKEEPQLFNEFSAEIRKMDANYQKLKSDLPASPNQEETVRAMIQNLQIQTELLNQQLNVIQQINKVKKEQKDDTQQI
ncbi:MAG: hypothetical protein ACO1NS_00525 [Daejeonella sp.]|uniref:hypothetical protein n=1 Tax=Daejeonella sp. JGW-45 TaxID=3034148 RepID=UPI0023EE25A9|nr:hypothetical protein [Daejeonella sp. JGW-45]